MWWHADNSTYGWLLQGLAVSDNVAGPYSFVNATSPLGNWSQDFGIFTDYKDGRSYALYSNGDQKDARDVYITSYNKDVSALEDVVFRFNKFDLEAPAIVQTDSSYYALMSHKTGYRPNSTIFRKPNQQDRLADLVPRRCCLQSRLSKRTVVSTIHCCPPQYSHLQFAVRILAED